MKILNIKILNKEMSEKYNIIYFKNKCTNEGLIYKFNKKHTEQLKFFKGLDESQLIFINNKISFYRNNKKIYIDATDYSKLYEFIMCSKFLEGVEWATDDSLPLLSTIVTIYVDNTFSNIYAGTVIAKKII